MYTLCFTIACCKNQKHKCMPQLIKRLKTKHNITRIRTRMACRRFENMEEFLISHANNRVMKGYISRNFKPRECNSSTQNMEENDNCACKESCRISCVIYELQYKISKKKHIGQHITTSKEKNRTEQHLNDAVKLKNKGIYSDSFANHLVK